MTDVYAGQFQRGAEGCWYVKSPSVATTLYRLRVFEPKPGTLVRGLWLGEGRDNEIAVPVDPSVFHQMFEVPACYLWSHGGRVAPSATVAILLSGEAEAIAGAFKTRPTFSKDSPHA